MKESTVHFLKVRTFKQVEYVGGIYSIGDPVDDKASRILNRKFPAGSGSLLLIGTGCGFIPALLNDSFATIDVFNNCYQDDLAVQKTMELNANYAHWNHELESFQENPFRHKKWDVILQRVDKQQEFSFEVTAQAIQQIKTDGWFHLLGANREGVKSAADRISKYIGTPDEEFSAQGSRLFSWKKSINWKGISKQNSKKSVCFEILHENEKRSIQLESVPGVFAYGKEDVGTQLLLNSFPRKIPGSVLDLGCGTGILGISAMLFGAKRVFFSDCSMEAVRCTQNNLKLLNLNANILCSFITENMNQKFDLILSNPPFHSGGKTLSEIGKLWLKSAVNSLHPKGELRIVANSFLPYEYFYKNQFNVHELIAEGNGFRVHSFKEPIFM